MEVVAHKMAREILQGRLRGLAVGRTSDVRSLEVVGSAAELVGVFAVAVVEDFDSVAGLGEEWVVGEEEDKIHLGVECSVVEGEDSNCEWFELEEVMMEVEQSAAEALLTSERRSDEKFRLSLLPFPAPGGASGISRWPTYKAAELTRVVVGHFEDSRTSKMVSRRDGRGGRI